MRIEAYHQVSQIYQTNSKAKTQETKGTAVSRDEVQISSAGRDYQVAKQAVADASDIREDRVAQLKARIGAGNYKVDAEDFASKLLRKYNA